MGRKSKAELNKPKGRAKGSGGLIRRGKWWLARWRVDGKTFTKSTKTTDEKEAYKKLEEFTRPFQIKDEVERLETIKAKISTQEHYLDEHEETRRKVKLEDLAETYFKRGFSQDAVERTKGMYRSVHSVFMDWAKATRKKFVWADDVTITDAEEFLEFYKKSHGPRTYNNVLNLLRWMWSCLKIKKNPWTTFKPRAVPPAKRRAFTQTELDKIFNYLENGRKHKYNNDLKILFQIGLYTGLRLNDACNLRYDDVHLDKGVIHIMPSKTKKFMKTVTIPIHPVLFASLVERFKERKDDEYILPYMRHQYQCRSISARIRDTLKLCGIQTSIRHDDGTFENVLGFHALRHTFVSRLANLNAPQNMVQQLVGHATNKMTSKYYHADLSLATQYLSAMPKPNSSDQVELVDVKLEKPILDKLNELSNHNINDYLRKMIAREENTIEIS